MSSIVLRRFAAITALTLLLASAGTATAAGAHKGASVVAQLYKDFAWMAITGQPDLFGADLAHQHRAILQRYFDPVLASLLVQDATCQVKFQGICNLDFEPLFASQDPSVIDLEVHALGPGKISVEFKNPVSQKLTTLEFKGATVSAGKWRITDIIYRSMGDASLKQILQRKIP